MRVFRAELHVHTVLSPCAEVEMIPPLIVEEALDRGIDLIAITDHNASANIEAVQHAARGTNLVVLPGMELQTREEVHLLCLFDDLDQVQAWQKQVDLLLPDIENDAEHFGGQFIVDETGDYLGSENQLLLVSAEISLDEAVFQVNKLGGMAIPAHVDRKANGLLAILGFVPEGLPVPALEVSRHYLAGKPTDPRSGLGNKPLIQSGDVHRLDEFLGVNEFLIDTPSILEFRLAFSRSDGRRQSIRDFRI